MNDTAQETEKPEMDQATFEETTKGKALTRLKAIQDNDNITRGGIFDEIENVIQILEGNTMDIQVQRMYRFDSNRPLKAFADIIINDVLLIKGIKVLEGKNGLFVSMPQEQAKDKKWYDAVRCLSVETRELITNVTLSAYKDE